ncbi:hypothetical protein B9Z55_015297 [Caenorhabditis nigoni]|uniref:Receptor L-domain domain-containing protein n=1 Tax=Caenorhabditis nigoni TaxID=1611254 RepID=A0A2G5U9K6_9PELO|nr:hypothetical protein B9Z55_015297 [Caenorhabditis nigoni]
MFDSNPFIFKAVCLLILLRSFDAQEKKCLGREPQELEDGCTIIETKPLVFKGTQKAVIRTKVAKIHEIYAGLEIIETDYENFDFLNKTLRVLKNSEGAAITIRKNTKLKRLGFWALSTLEAKKDGAIVIIDKDPFAQFAEKDRDALRDMKHLEFLSRIGVDPDNQCPQKFAEIVGYEEKVPFHNYWVPLTIVGVIGIIVVLGMVVWRTRTKKALKAKKAESPQPKDLEKKTDGGEGVPEKAVSMQGKVAPAEDPKNK